ncbi:NfeD family protein [Acidaminobacter sp. JC074]|uniref:NfeD family protein n=1 Tax=Acidaminobacter sp. JC074 TaxID=2530199 RepID=UPI001F1038CA|nr:NfeD family protein [Acidaminobacter sp. JC074]MCH4887326.1 NfeD family protein [Acidaminobacter sp. JC074]
MTVNILGLSIPLSVIWMIIAIGFGLAEGLTLGLTFIWFAGGALLAMIASFLGLPIFVQVIAFIVGSALMLIYTRPVAKKVLKIGATKTNVDSLIGKEGIVIKELKPFALGQVKVKGQIWSAKACDDEAIAENERVEVVSIEGVKLIVKPMD